MGRRLAITGRRLDPMPAGRLPGVAPAGAMIITATGSAAPITERRGGRIQGRFSARLPRAALAEPRRAARGEPGRLPHTALHRRADAGGRARPAERPEARS